MLTPKGRDTLRSKVAEYNTREDAAFERRVQHQLADVGALNKTTGIKDLNAEVVRAQMIIDGMNNSLKDGAKRRAFAELSNYADRVYRILDLDKAKSPVGAQGKSVESERKVSVMMSLGTGNFNMGDIRRVGDKLSQLERLNPDIAAKIRFNIPSMLQAGGTSATMGHVKLVEKLVDTQLGIARQQHESAKRAAEIEQKYS